MIVKPPRGTQLRRGSRFAGDLLGSWLFNDRSTEYARDSSGYDTHLDTWINAPIWDRGGLKTSLNDVIYGPSRVPAIGTGNYTIFVKAYIDVLRANAGIVAFDNIDPVWANDIDGHLFLYDGGVSTDSTGVLSTGQDLTMAWVRSSTAAGGLKYFIDGVSAGTAQHAGSINAPANIRIGGDRSPGPLSFDGVIKVVHVFGRALSDVEIVTLDKRPYIAYQHYPLTPWADVPAAGGLIIPIIMHDRRMRHL